MGDWTINFTTAFSVSTYAVAVAYQSDDLNGGRQIDVTAAATTSVKIRYQDTDANVAADTSIIYACGFGDQ